MLPTRIHNTQAQSSTTNTIDITITRSPPSPIGVLTIHRKNKKFEIQWVPYLIPFFCHKDFKTVFVFVLAQLEGPPQNSQKHPKWRFGGYHFIEFGHFAIEIPIQAEKFLGRAFQLS